MDISITTLLAVLLPVMATGTLFALLVSLALVLGLGRRGRPRLPTHHGA